MKYFLFVLFVFLLQVALAQEQGEILHTEINIEIKQKSIRNVLDQIEQKANVTFSYNNSVLNTDSVISVLVFNGKLEHILEKLMSPDMSFIISSNNIIFYQLSKSKPEKKTEAVTDKLAEKVPVAELPLKSNTEKPAVREAETVLQIKPYVIEDVSIGSFDKSEQDTLAMISLVPVSFTTNIKDADKENTSKNIKWQKPRQRAVRRNNANIYSTGKISAKYAVAPFYQVLNEKIQYNNFGSGEENERIKDNITSSEKSSLSNRMGIKASVTFDYLKLTTGLALLTSNEKYRYESSVDSADIIIIPDTLGNSLSGKNTYRYLSVPLFIGYERELAKNLTISGSAGVWLNFLNSAKGKYVNLVSGPPYEVSDLNTEPLNKLRTDLAADISLEYEFLRNTPVSFSASYMHPINSIFKKDYPVTKTKTAFGYSFAIIRKF